MNTTHPLSKPPVQDLFALIGRALIALLFVPAGWGKIAGFSGLVGYIQSMGVPLPEVCAAIAIVAELGLGLLLLVGWQARWAALGLAIFVAVITPIFHAYWSADAAQVMMQQQAFFKNIAVVGGLLAIATFGAGGWSLDGMRGTGARRATMAA
ncbi:DoxX family protein [Caenimonas koreensis]|uniref:DoxX family membrane protein n=1 Tax=Caenimonas koreensis DSM 17982 TaxID=1121255 RepID=A0A844B2H5_9BURK|nr:DoxX family protein [Caenimonas koreensis]MRD47413.1 DoxX family membrane protein [Caenimonas koreensis DSM 17982]